MNKAGQMPEAQAVFYLLQFPSNFLCRPGFDLRLILNLLCAAEGPWLPGAGGSLERLHHRASSGLGEFY